MAGINKIIIIPTMPIFNKEVIVPFEKFSIDDSQILYSTLYHNHKDVFTRLNGNLDVTYCFDENDKDCLPKAFNTDETKKYFINTDKIWQSVTSLLSKQFIKENTCILLVFSNSIGFSRNVIYKCFNMLNYDDNNILLGKTISSKLSFVGMNFYPEKLFERIKLSNTNYEEMLHFVNKSECFLHTLGGYLTVENMCSFRELYKLLSKKESIEFCSQEIHEQFTYLFIEYKGLL